MKNHKYQIGDIVESKTILSNTIDCYLESWHTVEIVDTIFSFRPDMLGEPVYLVRLVNKDGIHSPFLMPEDYLRNKIGQHYCHNLFNQKCREIEPTEIIDECVQPISPWTESLINASMARERAEKKRKQRMACCE